jgi:uncharacterized protein YebE (UPF0316 family)
VSAPTALLPLVIFAAEVCVVTLSTMRTIFVARGMKVLAPVLGFFEISTWLFAIGAVLNNLSDWTCSAAFAGGFTLGNFLGILVEEKLAMGNVVVRIITQKDPADLVDQLRAVGYGFTRVDGQGSRGPVQIVLSVIRRKDTDRVLGLARRFDPHVFYSVDEIQAAAAGVAPAPRRRLGGLLPGWLRPARPQRVLTTRPEGVTP